MLIAIAVALMLAMLAYDLPPVVREKQWGEFAVYSALWIAGLILAILQISGVSYPNPTTLITEALSPFGEAFARLLGLS